MNLSLELTLKTNQGTKPVLDIPCNYFLYKMHLN